MLTILKHRLEEAALAPASGGGQPAAPAPGAAPASAPAPGSAPNPGAPSNLAPQPGAPAANNEWLQSKYHVKKADGTLDEAASIRKQAEAYAPLAKRLGTDETRPEKVDGYRLEPPKDVDKKLFDEFLKDADTVKFIAAAHEKGFSNSQLQFIVGQMVDMAGLVDKADVTTRDAATRAYLKEKIWKEDAQLDKGIADAIGVVNSLAAKTGINQDMFTHPMTLSSGVILPPLINDPRALALLTAIAPELKLGQQPDGSTLPATEVESLMKSKAYMDPKHPDHAVTKERVNKHFASLPGANQRPRGPVVFQT